MRGRLPRAGFRLTADDHLIEAYRPGGGMVEAAVGAAARSPFGGTWPTELKSRFVSDHSNGDPGMGPQFHTFVDSTAAWGTIP